jgi:hypothetical protein
LPVFENITGTINAAVMVGEINAIPWASNSKGPRASFFKARAGGIDADIAANPLSSCRWLRRVAGLPVSGEFF